MSNTISKVHNNKHFNLDVSQHKKEVTKIKYHHIKIYGTKNSGPKLTIHSTKSVCIVTGWL
jgi:hypothetical protein